MIRGASSAYVLLRLPTLRDDVDAATRRCAMPPESVDSEAPGSTPQLLPMFSHREHKPPGRRLKQFALKQQHLKQFACRQRHVVEALSRREVGHRNHVNHALLATPDCARRMRRHCRGCVAESAWSSVAKRPLLRLDYSLNDNTPHRRTALRAASNTGSNGSTATPCFAHDHRQKNGALPQVLRRQIAPPWPLFRSPSSHRTNILFPCRVAGVFCYPGR